MGREEDAAGNGVERSERGRQTAADLRGSGPQRNPEK